LLKETPVRKRKKEDGEQKQANLYIPHSLIQKSVKKDEIAKKTGVRRKTERRP